MKELDLSWFLGILTLIFITLKLCHVIFWSWVWVLAPLWIPLTIAVFVLISMGLLWVVKNRN